MARKGSITGNGDGKDGGNDSYTVKGRGVVDRKALAKEVDQGKHDGYHTVEIDGEKWVRSNPDNTTSDNINRD
jgi:hypothetical protein